VHPENIFIKDYTYELTEERIAKYPLPQRDESKLLIYKNGKIEENNYYNLDKYIPSNSLLVFNNTKVVEARLIFQKSSGSVIELFCLEPAEEYPDITTAMMQKKKEIVQLLAPEFDEQDNVLPLSDSALLAIKDKLSEMELLKTKDLFSVELAGALIGSSPTNSFKGLASSRSGVWLNLRWSPAKSMMDFTGVARYSWANNTEAKVGKDSSFLDLGVALNYQKDKFNLSLEFVSRNDYSVKKNYDRFAFVANYVLSENVIIVASIGKNFSNVDNIVSAFGVKFGVSRSRVSLSAPASR